MSELTKIANASKSESLRDRILTKGARLEALQDLVTVNAFQRDQGRLNRKANAVYKKLGLDMDEDDSVQNFLGDVTISEEKKNGVSPWLAAALTAGALGLGAVGASLLPSGEEKPQPTVTAEDEPQIGYGIRIK